MVREVSEAVPDLLVVQGVLDLLVKRVADRVQDERERRTRVGDRPVAGLMDHLAVDGGACAGENPEAREVVDVDPHDVLARRLDEILVDSANSVEGFLLLPAEAVETRSE